MWAVRWAVKGGVKSRAEDAGNLPGHAGACVRDFVWPCVRTGMHVWLLRLLAARRVAAVRHGGEMGSGLECAWGGGGVGGARLGGARMVDSQEVREGRGVEVWCGVAVLYAVRCVRCVRCGTV